MADFTEMGFNAFNVCPSLEPNGSDGKESTCLAGGLGSIPGLGRSPGGGHGNPLQCSCLENPMNGGAWWATVDGVAKGRTRLSDSAQHKLGRISSFSLEQGEVLCFQEPFHKVTF